MASRHVYNVQVQISNAQQSFGNLLILAVIAALAAVTLVSMLAVATFERRRSVRLLARTGATARQVTGMFGWHALFVTSTGTGAGVLVAAGTLIGVNRSGDRYRPALHPAHRSVGRHRPGRSPRRRHHDRLSACDDRTAWMIRHPPACPSRVHTPGM